MVIAHTGTTIVHGMGYSLTYFKDIPHGKANGLLMSEYLKFNYDLVKRKVDNILKLLNVKGIDEFGVIVDKLLCNEEKFTEGDFKLYASIAMKQKSTSYNIRSVTEEDLITIMKNCLVGE
jgi:alcohol dehydrogenase class IV